MMRYDIINHLIKKYGYTSYVEIGLQHKVNCFDKIECGIKVSVDPDPAAEAHYKMTSDKFFEEFERFPNCTDIFFCDGLHESPQLFKDVENALHMLTECGSIVCHDANPQEEIHAKVPRESRIWNGDVWKDIVKLRANPLLTIYTVDTDYGCTVIQRGSQNPLLVNPEDLTWENFQKNRKEWLNLISVEEFLAL